MNNGNARYGFHASRNCAATREARVREPEPREDREHEGKTTAAEREPARQRDDGTLEERATDEGRPRRAARQHRQRREQPEHHRSGMVEPAAVGTHERRVRTEHVADEQIDAGDVFHREVGAPDARDQHRHEWGECQQEDHRDEPHRQPMATAVGRNRVLDGMRRFRAGCVHAVSRLDWWKARKLPTEAITTMSSPRLVEHAGADPGVRGGARTRGLAAPWSSLLVGGTGVVAFGMHR